MKKSRLSKNKQLRLIEHFVAGTTARCAACLVGINKSSTAYYFQGLRTITAPQIEQESQEVLGGEIEADESYFGGTRKGNQGRERFQSLSSSREEAVFIQRLFPMHPQHVFSLLLNGKLFPIVLFIQIVSTDPMY